MSSDPLLDHIDDYTKLQSDFNSIFSCDKTYKEITDAYHRSSQANLSVINNKTLMTLNNNNATNNMEMISNREEKNSDSIKKAQFISSHFGSLSKGH